MLPSWARFAPLRGVSLVSSPVDASLYELIGGIYDAVIEPERWQDAIDRIRARYSLLLGALSVSRLPDGLGTIQVASNVPKEFLLSIPRFGTQNLDVWGGSARLFALPLEEPLVYSEVIKGLDIPENDWVREWSRPQGIVDAVALMLERNQRMLAAATFSRHEDGPPITDGVVNGLRTLAPHLRRAVTISGLIDEVRALATTFEAALDAVGTGVVLVGAGMRIVHANASATAMLDRGDPVVDERGRLAVRHEVAPGRLESAITAAATNEALMGQSGVGIPARRADGTPTVLHVMPLQRRSMRHRLLPAATAAVFVAEPGHEPNLLLDALTATYGLTPAEARVFQLIASGRSNAEMAGALGIKPSTVRTHMQSLFNKTSRRSRAELTALAGEFGAFG